MVIIPFDKLAFGIKIVWLFAVSNLVTKICISVTVPITPCASIVSPTLNGLNNIISIPPAKFERDPCKDNPTAKPAAPRIATKEEVSIPNLDIKVTNSNTRKTQINISAKNLDKVGSKFLFIIIFFANLLIKRIAYNPTIKITNAEINLGEYSKSAFIKPSE